MYLVTISAGSLPDGSPQISWPREFSWPRENWRLLLMAKIIIVAKRNGDFMLPELSSDQADRSSLGGLLVERLAAAFRSGGWNVVPLVGDWKADLVVARGKSRYVAEVKVARDPRR